jgi:superfamily II DNA/RNA helicase
MTFESLGLSPDLCATLAEKGYTAPTITQEKIIPLILRGADVLACAPTGTGKTGAFCLPLVEILSEGASKARLIRCLILVPTRELASQVSENFKAYTKNHKLKVAEFIGGASIQRQKQVLAKGVDVAVATPGRLLDLHASGAILPTEIKNVVLDEADRMLDMGFLPDLKKILSMLPPMRQTALLSATMAPEIKKLAQEFLMSPKEVMIEAPSSTSANIDQFFVSVPGIKSTDRGAFSEKIKLLKELLRKFDVKSAIIFANKKHQVDKVAVALNKAKFKSDVIHGDLTQNRRNQSIERMKAGDVQFLIASDVAARGIDIMDLPCVINMDIPMNTEDYVHRIGRTGRAGAKGISYTFVTKDTVGDAQAVMKLIGKDVPFIKEWGNLGPTDQGAPKKPAQKARDKKKDESQSLPQKNPKKDDIKKDLSSKPTTSPDPQNPVKGFGDHIPDFLK